MSKIKASSGDRFFPWEDNETRQQYANRRVAEYQRLGRSTFDDLLFEFRLAGIAYDMGVRSPGTVYPFAA